jgi:hypothetical protein
MTTTFVAWVIAALLLLLLAAWLGPVIKQGLFGILIDERGRYSLSRLQLVLWSLVVLSLLAGVFVGRLLDGPAEEALNFEIPPELLIVLGISVGSTVTSQVIKNNQDQDHPEDIAASDASDPPRFAQVFLAEEGAMADRMVDVAKFQNFWFTLILVVGYVAIAINTLASAASPSDITALPGFNDAFLVLLGISHAGYLAGKLPTPRGNPKGLTLLRMQQEEPQVRLEAIGEGFVPRNRAGAERVRRRRGVRPAAGAREPVPE